jgi:hypothetical protein
VKSWKTDFSSAEAGFSAHHGFEQGDWHCISGWHC